jgi:hypothetical protein
MTGRVSVSVRRPFVAGEKVHLVGHPIQGGRTRCGKPPRLFGAAAFQTVEREEDGVDCRMCLRCKDIDAGLRYTR